MTESKKFLLVAAFAALLASAYPAAAMDMDDHPAMAEPAAKLSDAELADVGGPFALTNQDGKAVTDADYKGKFLLVYFGYTYCPDMCPTGLQNIARSLDKLGKTDAAHIQPLFVTVDPARDTPAKLKEYAASFHPAIVSLTGTPEQIAAVAKAYKVYYKKAEEVEAGEYIMDHSTAIYLMGPDGKYIANFSENENPNKMASAIRAALKKAGPKTP